MPRGGVDGESGAVSSRTASPADLVLTSADASACAEKLRLLVEGLSRIVLGKEAVVRLAVTGLLAKGHLLFEDQPGVGKTLLSQALAQSLGLQFRRVQFTSDLLPADILGASIYDREAGSFSFHPGPVFTQVLLADEINRATPKTQSALLEAMEEGKVTCDGTQQGQAHPVERLEKRVDAFVEAGNFGRPDIGRHEALELVARR